MSACAAAATATQEGWKSRETRMEGGKTHSPTICGKRVTQRLSFTEDSHSSFFPPRIPLPTFTVRVGVSLHQRLPAPVDACERCPPLHLVSVQCPPASSPVVYKLTLTIGRPPVVRRGRRRAAPGEFISMRNQQVFHTVHAGVSLLARTAKVAAP